jgi:hypothetical protein
VPHSSAITDPASTSPKKLKELAYVGAQFKSGQSQHQTDIDNQNLPTTATPPAPAANTISENEHRVEPREGMTEEERLKDCVPVEKYLREGYKDEGSTDVKVNKGKPFTKNG